jgi:hypothetical protein
LGTDTNGAASCQDCKPANSLIQRVNASAAFHLPDGTCCAFKRHAAASVSNIKAPAKYPKIETAESVMAKKKVADLLVDTLAAQELREFMEFPVTRSTASRTRFAQRNKFNGSI